MTKFIFLKDNTIIPTKDYPLLQGYEHSTKKPVKTSFFFSIEDLDEVIAQEVHDFLKHTSLKEALKEQMGISSAQITSFVNQVIFTETKDCVELNLNYYLIVDVLATIFLQQAKPNPDAFLKALSQRKLIAMIAPLYNRKLHLQKFLNDNFSEEKKLEILQNSSRQDQISDMLSMYMQNDEFFKEYLSKKSFKEIASFGDCHDLLAMQMSKITQENFDLKQETHYPVLKNLDNQLFSGTHRLVVPQTHHDLVVYGNLLGHCIGSKHYAEAAYKGKCVLLAIVDNNRLKYTLEIVNKHITQIQGQSRSYPPKEIESKLRKTLEDAGLIK